MIIRPPQPQDHDGWNVLWQGYSDFYQVDVSATAAGTWQRLLDPAPDGPFCLLYENDDGQVLGLVHYLFHAQTRLPVPRCYLNDLFTADQARGKGVARALIEAVSLKAGERNCDQVYWLTQSFNDTARRLYDRVATVTPFIKYQR